MTTIYTLKTAIMRLSGFLRLQRWARIADVPFVRSRQRVVSDLPTIDRTAFRNDTSRGYLVGKSPRRRDEAKQAKSVFVSILFRRCVEGCTS